MSGKVGNNLEAANSLLKIMTPMAPSPEELQQQKFSLLKRMVSLNPDNIESTAELAVIYDKKGKKDKCLSLLEPLSNKLGTTEGARILGSIYLDKGKNEEALKIIEPYVTAKSKEIFKTNKEYNKQFVNAFNFSKSLLKSGRAYGFEYRKYKTLDNAGKKKLVNKYIFNYIKNSSSLKKAKAAYDKACVAVPISLKEAGIRCSNGEFKRADTILKNIASAAKTTPHYQVLRKRTDTGLGIKTLEKEK